MVGIARFDGEVSMSSSEAVTKGENSGWWEDEVSRDPQLALCSPSHKTSSGENWTLRRHVFFPSSSMEAFSSAASCSMQSTGLGPRQRPERLWFCLVPHGRVNRTPAVSKDSQSPCVSVTERAACTFSNLTMNLYGLNHSVTKLPCVWHIRLSFFYMKKIKIVHFYITHKSVKFLPSLYSSTMLIPKTTF